MILRYISLVCVAWGLWVGPAFAQTTPTLPTEPTASVSTTRPTVNGTTCTGTTQATVQACIDTAAALTSGTGGNNVNEVVITAGSSFTGPITLKARGSGATGWIVIRSSASGSLAENTRVAPADVSNMATIVAQCGSAGSYTYGGIQTREDAHHYWIIGIEVVSNCTAVSSTFVLVDFGADDISDGKTGGHHFVVDRCYVHGSSISVNVLHAINLNAYQGYSAVLDSYISEIHQATADTQAILVVFNAGPVLIQNNYLAAASENVMLGGSSSPGLDALARIPHDVKILRNTIEKPIAWKTDASVRYVKALVELKTGVRVLVEGNVMSGSWLGCASCEVGGFSMRLTVRNEENGVPFAVLEDVTIRYNKITDTAGVMNLTSSDDTYSSGTSKRIYVHDNLWYDMSCAPSSNFDLSISAGNTAPGEDYTFDHNTVVSCDTSHNQTYATAYTPSEFDRFSTRNSIFSSHSGVTFRLDDSASTNLSGTAALNDMFDTNGWFYDHNAIVRSGGTDSSHPSGNFWPTSYTNVGFVSIASDDYHLDSGSAYKNAGSDGLDVGADIDALDAAIAGSDSTPPAVPTGVYITRQTGGGGAVWP